MTHDLHRGHEAMKRDQVKQDSKNQNQKNASRDEICIGKKDTRNKKQETTKQKYREKM